MLELNINYCNLSNMATSSLLLLTVKHQVPHTVSMTQFLGSTKEISHNLYK